MALPSTRRIAVTAALGLFAGCGDDGAAADDGGTDTDVATDTASPTEGSSTASTTASNTASESGESGDDDSETSEGETDGPTPSGPATVGVFSAAVNYFELDTGSEPLKFHFGSWNSQWGAIRYPLAGDFDGDGFDTVGVFDLRSGGFLLTDVNDTDEFDPVGKELFITDVPRPPAVVGEFPGQLPVVADWGGHGHAGLGVYHVATNTFYLKEHLATGAPDVTVTLDPTDGYPDRAWPIAGDFDGDGQPDIGLSDGTTIYLRYGLEAGPPDVVFEAGGLPVAGDFNGDGTDTVSSYMGGMGTFAIRNANEAEAETSEVALGYVEQGYWSWLPVAGRWHVPEEPLATSGYEWPEAPPAQHGLNGPAIAGALDDAANVADVYSVLVARHGDLLAERYYHGFDRHIAGNIKSVSKSVLSALYGIALNDGSIASLDDPVADYLPDYFQGLGQAKQDITVRNIMNMQGGLQWSEGPNYIGQGMMLAEDHVTYVLEQPLVSTPGTGYNYSTGLTHVGSAALTEATGLSSREFARTELFAPLGISSPKWDNSPEGYYVGGAEMWMRPRDMARFGQLFLEGGSVGGQTILDASWVDLSANPTVPESGGRLYGYWWRERPWNNYPAEDSYFAWGHGGQFIFLFPAWDLVVVITSKWAVDQSASGAAASAIFSFVDNQILTAVTD